MIHPTCSEVLATVVSSFEREVVPDLSSTEARSSAATIAHLLRHVMLRIEHEGDILMRDIERLRALLAQIADWVERADPAAAASLRREGGEEGENLWTLARQGAEALRLRGLLVEAQQKLDSLDQGREHDDAYAAVRSAIGRYIGEQVMDEARLIEPAFFGKGPRR